MKRTLVLGNKGRIEITGVHNEEDFENLTLTGLPSLCFSFSDNDVHPVQCQRLSQGSVTH